MAQAASESETPRPRAVVIGASAGAVEALLHVLPALPRNYAAPVFIVVHLPPGKESILAGLLAAKCLIHVKEAEDKEKPQAGTAYVAPPDYHLLVEPDLTLSLSSDEPVLYSRPSIDVLFDSASDAYGSDLVGVVLTGANTDGAHGLRTIGAAGGVALVQTPDSADAFAMPTAALEACPSARALSLDAIASELKTIIPER